MAVASSRRLSETLEFDNESFKSAFEYFEIGVCLIDTGGHFIRTNRAFSTMLGYSRQQILKKNLSRITNEEDLTLSKVYHRRLLAGKKKSFTFLTRFFHKDGHVLWATVTASLIHFAGRYAPCFLNYVQDISNSSLVSSEQRFR